MLSYIILLFVLYICTHFYELLLDNKKDSGVLNKCFSCFTVVSYINGNHIKEKCNILQMIAVTFKSILIQSQETVSLA